MCAGRETNAGRQGVVVGAVWRASTGGRGGQRGKNRALYVVFPLVAMRQTEAA